MKNPIFKILLTVVFATTAISLSAEPVLLGNKALSGQTLDGEGAKAV